MIVDKTNDAQFSPPTLGGVSEAEVERHFAPFSDVEAELGLSE